MNPAKRQIVRCAGRLLLLASLVCGAGCTSWNLQKSFSWIPGIEEPAEVPASVVAVWSPAVLQQGNETPTRGFGGRLMFYDKHEKPVRVEGTLVVYAFDEHRHESVDPKADRKYVFTPEQLATHYSRSKLGPSYSVWIPWDKAGGPTQQVSMIARFSPSGGPAIVGSQARLALPGPPSIPSGPEVAPCSGDETAAAPVRPAAHYAPAGAPPGGRQAHQQNRQMATTTIDLPRKGR